MAFVLLSIRIRVVFCFDIARIRIYIDFKKKIKDALFLQVSGI